MGNSVSKNRKNRDTHQVVVRAGVFWGEILTRGEKLKTGGEKGYTGVFVPFPHP